MKLPLAIALLTCLVACSSPPPVRIGTVCAHDEATARRVAEIVERRAPQIAALFGSDRHRPEVWVSRSRRIGAAYGAVVSDCLFYDDHIVLGGDALSWPDEAMPDEPVVHELAHWYSFGTNWVPRVVDEGLALWAIVEVFDLNATVKVPEDWPKYLRLGSADFQAMSPQEYVEASWVGYWIVTRIGVDSLRELCTRAARSSLDHVPWRWIVEAVATGNA